MIIAELEKEIALKELQLENYVGLKREFDIRKEEDLLRLLRHMKPIAYEPFCEGCPRVTPFQLPGVTSDWDFYNTYWSLDAQVYVSPPSSLKIHWTNLALLRQAAVGCPIQDGRIETYMRHSGAGSTSLRRFLIFRATHPDGATQYYATYILALTASQMGSGAPVTTAGLLYNDGSNNYTVASSGISPELNADTWYQVRLTWWESSGVLVARFEYNNNGQWTPLCPDFTDPQNRNATSSTLKVGVSGAPGYTYIWFDDTVIYVAV